MKRMAYTSSASRHTTAAVPVSRLLLCWTTVFTARSLSCSAWLSSTRPRISSSKSCVIDQRASIVPGRHGATTTVSRMTTEPATASPLEGVGDHIRRVDTQQAADSLVERYKNFVFDCDGVLWGGSHPIEGSLEAVKALRAAGKRTFFVTNNSSKSRRQYCRKLEGFGVHGVGVEDIVTSGSAIAAYVKYAHPDVHTVYMVGEDGLEEELGVVGLTVAKEEERPAQGMTEDEFREAEQASDSEVGAVVVGLDTCFGFRQMCMASAYIQRGAHFLGTNPDVADRVGSLLMPGTGPILASIQNASGVTPVVVGKPNPLLIRRLMDENNLDAAETLMVGDRLDTDIMFGNAGGISSVLVLTGVSEIGDVTGLPPGGASTPTYLLEKLGDLLPAAVAAEAAAAATMGPVARI